MNSNINRCGWCLCDPIYIKYHDEEWGKPLHDDQKLFEFLTLEGMQAGLSWLTVLKKRENFREAFDNFDPIKVAKYDDKKIDELMNNAGIIRNKLKILATINNAARFQEIQSEFGSFDKYIWGFINNEPIANQWPELNQIPPKTELSDKISKDLLKRGFKFVGSTIIYAHMQATGMVNDHLISCISRL
jgi:DNA-3-methyladenine glycosylase I